MLDSRDKKLLIQSLRGEIFDTPPCWLMRQAGRYLPEYQQLRKKAKGFIDFCLTPELASQATLQPLNRFDLDAAIVFSDILLLPYALGQKVEFKENIGPVLDPIRTPGDIVSLSVERLSGITAPVYETIEIVKSKLPAKVALIGFAGAPWTVATYMIEGGTSRSFDRTKVFALQYPNDFQKLLDILVSATVVYLLDQIKAGAEVIQLFDSWAGVVPDICRESWIIKPTAKIISAVRRQFPEVPIIGFPRGIGVSYPEYVKETGVNGISLDQMFPLEKAAEMLQSKVTIQGALDPHILMIGGEQLRLEVQRQLQMLNKGAYIFNLGHGILPQTPPEHVEQLLSYIKP